MELNHQSTRQKLSQLQFRVFSKQHPEKDKVTERRNGIVTLCWRHQYACHAIDTGGSAEVRDNYNMNSIGWLVNLVPRVSHLTALWGEQGRQLDEMRETVIVKDVRAQKFPRTDFFKTLTAGRK